MAKTKWIMDPTHSELGFKIKHLMISNVSGTFGEYEAVVETDNEDFSTAQVKATIKAASVNTNNRQRDEHLRNADFFEAEKYPEISFQSDRVEKQDDESFILYGDLTMKGISRPIKLNIEYNGLAKDPWGGQRAGFVVTGKIKRGEFGLSFNSVLDTGGVALSDEVKIYGEVQMVKQEVGVAAAQV
jgi:polyisoprenoid-binding protein YceI